MIARLELEEKATGKRMSVKTSARLAKSRASLPYVPNPCFLSADTEDALWGSSCKEIVVSPYRPYSGQIDSRAETPRVSQLMSFEDEKILFLRYNYAKYRLWQLEQGSARRADKATPKALWQERAARTREQIATANMAMAAAMAKRIRGADCEFEDLLSEGYLTLLHCIEKFDVSRGFKFSTYACRAMLTRYYRMSSTASTHHQRFPVEYNPEMDRSDYADVRREEDRLYAIETIRKVIIRNQADLTPAEQTVVTGRFLVATKDGKPVTLKSVARQMCLSTERVRQIHEKSIRKLRAVLIV